MDRRFLFTLSAVLIVFQALAQNPVKWTFTAKDAGKCQVDLVFTGDIEDGWYTYSQFLESEDGPVATSITFSPGANYKLVGKAKESGDILKTYDKVFDMNLTKFKHKAVLTQRIEVTDPSKPVSGYITFMTCNDDRCLPPRDVDFSFKIPALGNCGTSPAPGNQTPAPATPAGGQGADPGGDQAGAEVVPAASPEVTPAAADAGAATPDDPNFKGFFSPKGLISTQISLMPLVQR